MTTEALLLPHPKYVPIDNVLQQDFEIKKKCYYFPDVMADLGEDDKDGKKNVLLIIDTKNLQATRKANSLTVLKSQHNYYVQLNKR